MKTALTYDDITLCPSFSEIESRQNIDLTTQLTTNYSLRIPLIASPMDTVCDIDMALAMMYLGGVGIIHRFMTIETQTLMVADISDIVTKEGVAGAYNTGQLYEVWNTTIPIAAAIGANGDYLERAQELTKAGANVILIDVAHGHHKFVKDAITNLKKHLPVHVDIIAGNVATQHAAVDLEYWGADAIRVGIGGGSLCTTRLKTGFGIPNITSLEDCSTAVNVPVIACGGIRDSGDIAKALAVGASSVILGSLLAGTNETPGPIIDGNVKRYRGAASRETKLVHNQSQRNVEGASTYVYCKGPVAAVVEGLMDGLRSALSYAGANNLTEFTPAYMRVTSAGVHEAQPHLIK
jgi:IMP dehydrogenase